MQNEGDIEKAFNFVNAAIKHKPNSPAVHLQKGQYYHEMNKKMKPFKVIKKLSDFDLVTGRLAML